MPANPTPAEGVVVPMESLRRIRGALRNAHARLAPGAAICNVSGAIAEVEHLLAARPAAPTQSAGQMGEVHTAVMDALRSEIMRQNPKACSEETDADMILPVVVPAGAECAYAPLDISALAEVVLPVIAKMEKGR